MKYYVNDAAQQNGDHEVHEDGCSYLALARSTTYLGVFASCHGAVVEARKHYNQANGCYYCCNACHTS